MTWANCGTKTEARAPSPKSLLKRLGKVKAVTKAEQQKPVPK